MLRANNLTIAGRVADASIELRAGEIVGLAGLVGAGRSELAFGIFGALPIASGTITVGDTEHTSMTPARAIALGIGLVTEDRKAQGLAMLLDVAANVSASKSGRIHFLRPADAPPRRAVAHEAIQEYAIACRGPRTDIATMSGGNQQKVIVARWRAPAAASSSSTSRRAASISAPNRKSIASCMTWPMPASPS